MSQLIIIAVLVISSIAGMAGAYKVGDSAGADRRDKHWQTAISTANAALNAAKQNADDAVRERDTQSARALAAKAQELKDKDRELEDARSKIPLSPDCVTCRIDRNRVERMRQRPASGHQSTIGPATGPAAATFGTTTVQVSPK